MNDSKIITLVATAGLLAMGCASAAPSTQLVNARAHYGQARNGDAQQYEPEYVHDAGEVLRVAEAVHERKPGSYKEKHLAYLADRLALFSISEGKHQAAKRSLTEAKERHDEILLTQRDDARQALGDAEGEIGQTNQALQDERRARKSAEQELQAAMESLSEIANIKADQQQIVITLSGSVLFKTNQASLLPIARESLSRVARVLREHDEDKDFTVEGHTDSRGASTLNQQLSLERARAVRSFLVQEGVASDRIEAVGRGESEPVASNNTADGRANNRRVEIIVRPTR